MSDRTEQLESALRGFIQLLDDQVLVRNTDDDHDIIKFMKQGARLVSHLAATNELLKDSKKKCVDE